MWYHQIQTYLGFIVVILVDGNKRTRNGLKSLFNLTEFFLPLEATNSKLTVLVDVRGGDTTSCETKKLSVKSVPSSQDESSKGNGNFSIRTNFFLFFQ